MVRSGPPEPAADRVLHRYGSEDTYYREFVRRIGAGEFAVQQCDSCGYLRWPPTRACTECLAEDWHWQEIDGHGEIWSVSVYERAYGSHRKPPYNVVVVRLDDAVTMLSTVVGTPDTELAPGQRVVADLNGPGPGLAHLVFRRDDADAE
jgi:uncharacterized OB-fold protein